jgi:dTDP-glucose pyrophosphorylase
LSVPERRREGFRACVCLLQGSFGTLWLAMPPMVRYFIDTAAKMKVADVTVVVSQNQTQAEIAQATARYDYQAELAVLAFQSGQIR